MSAVSKGSRRVAAAEEPQNIIRLRPSLSHVSALKASPGAADSTGVAAPGLGTDGNHPLRLASPPFHRRAEEVKSLRTDRGASLDEGRSETVPGSAPAPFRPRGRSGC
jgi:hypothetical protein